MKPGSVTKLDKKKQNNVKKIEHDVISVNCDVIVIFPVYCQFGAIWMSDSGCMVCKTCILINSKILSYQN